MKRWLVGVLGVVGLGLAVCGGLVAWVASDFADDSEPVEGMIRDGVHAISNGTSLSYIVEVNGGVVLIDAGMDPEATAIKAKLAELDDPEVFALLITHGHGDHVGGCGAFEGVPVIAHRDEIPLIQGETAAAGPVTRFMSNDGSCRVTQGVTDGGRVNLGRMIFEAVHLPGHTAGSVAWVGRRTVFFGDAASATTNGRVTGAKWVFTDDPARAAESLAGAYDRLPVKQLKLLAFGHTGPLKDLDALKDLR